MLGTNDKRVAEYAATLYHSGFASTVVVTGGLAHQDDLLATGWNRPEAEVFAEILERQQVPPYRILLETRASNTAENIRLSRDLICKRGMEPKRVLVVVKPFMQRRVFATHAVEWPEVPATVVSWSTTFDEYCTPELPPAKVTNIMMGDLQRLWIYSNLGYSAPQRIPDEVRRAYSRLRELGYTQHLIAENEVAA